MTVDPELFDRALTHRSYAYEQGGLPTNERLEFLGDSVLGLVVTEHLFVTYPDLSEGQLAKLRAAVVNSRALADVARGLDLGAVIQLGRGEEATGGRDKSSILADTMEAVIGAVFLAARHRRRPHLRAPPVRPADGRGGHQGRRPGLEDQPAGDRLARRHSASPSTRSSSPAPTTPRASRPWWRSTTAATARAPVATRRRRSRTPPPLAFAALKEHARRRRRHADRRTLTVPELPEVEMVRRGLAGIAGRRIVRRRRPAPASRPAPPARSRGLRAQSSSVVRSPNPAAAASTCGSRSTTVTPSWPTSA